MDSNTITLFIFFYPHRRGKKTGLLWGRFLKYPLWGKFRSSEKSTTCDRFRAMRQKIANFKHKSIIVKAIAIFYRKNATKNLKKS